MLTGKTIISRIFMLGAVPYLFLCACDSRDQKKLNAQWEQQASVNAQNYIRQKYGFFADVKSAAVDRRPGALGTSPTSDVFVDMEYQGKSFQVFITGKTASSEGADNYQIPEIETALIDYIRSGFSGIEQLHLTPRKRSQANEEHTFCSVYYDGSNLREAAVSSYSGFSAYCLHTDLSNKPDFAYLDDYCKTKDGIQADFYSCRTADPMGDPYTAGDPVYCESFRQISETGETYLENKLQTIGGYSCYIAPDQTGSLKIEKTEPPIPEMFTGRGISNAEIDSEALCMTADSGMAVSVYVPLSEIRHFDPADSYSSHIHLRLGEHYFDAETNVHDSARHFRIVGDYAVIEAKLAAETPQTYVFLHEKPLFDESDT